MFNNNQNNSLFSNPYLVNSGPKSPSSSDIANLYQKLDTLKAQQSAMQQMENVRPNNNMNDESAKRNCFRI